MDHVAILRKSNIKKGDNLLNDVLTGQKTIESRWYVNRIDPFEIDKTGYGIMSAWLVTDDINKLKRL